MARPNQEDVATFVSVTGLSESAATQKLEEHGCNLNEALNAHFSEGDHRSIAYARRSVAPPEDDLMDIDEPVQLQPTAPFPSLLSAARSNLNPFSLLDDSSTRRYFDGISDFGNSEPFVSHPREVREIPIEVKDDNATSGRSGSGPVIEDVTGSEYDNNLAVRGTVVVDEEDDIPVASSVPDESADIAVIGSRNGNARLVVSEYGTSPDIDDVEEEMIRAAIEASRREIKESSHVQKFGGPGYETRQSQENPELAQEVELGEIPSSNGRLEKGNSSLQDEVEEVEQPLIRHRSGRVSSRAAEVVQEIDDNLPPSEQNEGYTQPQLNDNNFPSDEWGGISSVEHDEAVMLEAAMFGGIPEGTSYQFAYAPHQFRHGESRYPRPAPRPPSPSLEAQRLIREQQDDEYLASLQADREKELKAKADAEARHMEEEAAQEASLEEEKRKEEESRKILGEQQELERLLAAKEASLPKEPTSDDENAVNLLVRMPDGSRRGRRFLKSDKLQFLFDFIDIGKAVKPGSYRLVRPYLRRAFGYDESTLTLNELGLTSKQEALYLELI